VGAPLPGRFQSGFQDSPLDGQQRLAAEVPLQLAWAGPGQRWLLQYGQGTGDYLRAWNSSVLFNLMISALLLVMLVGHLRAYQRRRAQVARADGTMQLLGQVLNTLPTPLALVEQDGAIAVGNSALLERFGALGGPGQPVARLFADGADWHALTAAGKADALAMCCRRGDMVAQAHCTALQARAARYWLLSLVDVTDQQQRMSALVGAAMRDPLTGLANRRGYAEGAAAALAASAAHGAPLALLALDLDHFKRVNDTHGHAAGDQVLVTVARLIGGAMRDGDLAARLGGEEFTLLLPGADAAQAHAVAERVRLAIAATPIKIDSGAVLTQTVSIGISLLLPGETALEAAQERADAALYRAKELGRNRTVAA
jgi:diguanylate cyclase (GGDEF)-like protein